MKAYILASGVGSRMRPLTNWLPKPMVPIMNRPLISHLIEHIRPNVGHIRVNVAHNKQPLIDYLQWQDNISHFDEGEAPIGSAKTLFLEKGYLADQRTLVCCGDLMSNWDIASMVRFHEEKQALVTVATRWVEDPRSFGVAVTDGAQRITSFQEKPQQPASHYISCGIYLFSPKILAYWNEAWQDIGGDLLPDLVSRDLPVYAWPMGPNCQWSDIGNPRSYLNAHLQLTGAANTVDPAAEVMAGARLHRCVVGAGAVIDRRARLEHCIVWPGTQVGECQYRHAILTPQGILELEEAALATPPTGEFRPSSLVS
jgi:mannose-1-phosphate guanylyltransferase